MNQTIGSQTNVNVILNQTVIQQQQPTVQTTTGNQQQMVAININGNQTLIPLSMFTKLLQPKYSTTTTTVRMVFFRLNIFFIRLNLSRLQQTVLLNKQEHHRLYRMVLHRIVKRFDFD